MTSRAARAAVRGMISGLVGVGSVWPSAVEAAAPPAPVSPTNSSRPRVSPLVYGLYLREKLWDIPLNYAGAGGGIRVLVTRSAAVDLAAELLVGRSEAGLSSTLTRCQWGVDASLGALHLRPALHLGLTTIDRTTTDKTLPDFFVGGSLRFGPQLALGAQNAVALELSVDAGSTSTYGYGLVLRYVRL